MVLLVVARTTCSAEDAALDVERAVEEVLRRPAFRGSTFGIYVRPVGSSEVVFEHRGDALLAPASTAKLVSCAGALATLGKDFRFETPVVRTGPIVDGELRGDLVLVAKGDPNLSQRITPKGRLAFRDRDHTYAGFTEAELVPGDPLVVLREFAKKVKAAGIRRISGDVIVDDGLFQETHDSFVGPISAICINDNVVDITLSPGKSVGDPLIATWQPKLPSVNIRVRARTTPRRAANGKSSSEAPRVWIDSTGDLASFVVHGELPLGSAPVLRVGKLQKPAQAAAHFFRDVLSERGIKTLGQSRQARFGPRLYGEFEEVARHISPPFSESIRVTLKVSHNLHATMYPPLVGALKGERADRRSGFAKIAEFLEKSDVDVSSVVLQSGSGGGRADALSPRFLVDLLDVMAKRDDFPVFYDALAIGGQDGTISRRFRKLYLRGRVRAKTGTLVYRSALNDRWIYLSKALSGYVNVGTKGDPHAKLAFTILIGNTVTKDTATGVEDLFRAQEDILEAIVRHWLASRDAQ